MDKTAAHHKLQRIFRTIVVIAGVITLVSFSVTTYLINARARRERIESAEVVFEQTKAQFDSFVDSIDRMYYSVVNNDFVFSFFAANDFGARWDFYQSMVQFVGNNLAIDPNLRGMTFYDNEGRVIGSKGSAYIRRSGLNTGARYSFSGLVHPITSDLSGENFFQVTMPVYQVKEDAAGRIGTIGLVFDTLELEEIAKGALFTDRSAFAVLDGDNQVLSSAGDWSEEYASADSAVSGGGNLVFSWSDAKTGWRLVSVTPENSITRSLFLANQVVNLTYLLLLGILLLVVLLVYRQILRPITEQISFMTNFKNDPGQRIRVTGDTEVSEMAVRMNRMLDDIDDLNREMIRSEQRNMELEYAKKQTEIVAYKSQINPHFLYNTFACIRGMALHNGQREIAEITQSLSRLFRYNVKGKDEVTVEEAVKSLADYGRIIHYRFGDKIRVDIRAEENVRGCMLPKMILQPLVENAVLHGLESKEEGGRVDTEICEDSGRLVITIADNGLGVDEAVLAKLTSDMREYDESGQVTGTNWGIGILNVYRRLKLFYGDDCSMRIDSSADSGTTIVMTLPVKREEEDKDSLSGDGQEESQHV